MTNDVRTLLHDSAEAPTRAPDLDGAMQRARVRRLRRRGLSALAAVVVLALVAGALAIGGGGGDDAQIAIGSSQAGSAVPDGWKTITGEPSISMAVPDVWESSSLSASPAGTPLLNVVNLADDSYDVLLACTMHRDPTTPPTSPGSSVTLWEYPGNVTQVPGIDPGSGQMLDVVDRPTTFAGELLPGPRECKGARYDQLAFRDADRVFLVRVVSVFPTAADEQARLALAAKVLNTLQIGSLAGTTTTAPPVVTIPDAVTPVPPPSSTPTASAPAFEPSTDDERAIQALFVAWLRDHPDDETRMIVEDADVLLDSIHEGLAQHSAADLAKYSGTVSAIRMLDADHAEVQYTLLFDGRAQFGLRTGVAVRIDGRWLVSRATECALLSLGGITCPP